MRQTITELVAQAIDALRQAGVVPADAPDAFNIERPRDKNHGDFSTNAALVLAKAARMKPRDLAQRILDALPPEQAVVDRWEVAGPGFINFFIAPSHLRQLVAAIRRQGAAYGHGGVGAGRWVQVEFVSANPTGPMHVGHGRGAVTGDAIARLLEASGFRVQREYYVNDAGGQVKVLGQSVLLRYRELFGHAVAIPAGCYPGEYVVDIARALKERDGERWLAASETPEEPPEAVVRFAIDANLALIRETLGALNIQFDRWFSERDLHREGGIDHAVAALAEKGLVYEGVLEPPKGKQLEDWEPRPQLLFRSSHFGDEVDRPLKKSDGAYTYFAADIAYHLNKAERAEGFHRLVNVWGADHGGYVKRVQAAIEALTGHKELLDVRLVQMVNLTRGGKPVRMSKRAGTFVTLREVVDEVGADPVRFWFLTRAGTSQLDFDLDLAVSKSNDNPVFYVQYAHARIHSVWRQLRERGLDATPEALDRCDLGRLAEAPELDLIRLLGLYPETVEGAALAHEPHRIPFYLLDLAAAFHTYYNSHRILEDDAGLRTARLALIEAVGQVLRNGLALLGVSAPEQM